MLKNMRKYLAISYIIVIFYIETEHGMISKDPNITRMLKE